LTAARSTVIICTYHVTRVGPITIRYFGEAYFSVLNIRLLWSESLSRCRKAT